ncbi:DNA-binding protein [Rossellomorea aquimaris]|uniref:DNA-binding protein n=1 Tax=Rossellomorea aquimaris TaxID=189382 RepID=UPI001CD384D0|nr:DNA-binding protein [Rossellomorea aquimaris]MCA1057547.1 DNA-binding protein [Rossellomorea aquimaris]
MDEPTLIEIINRLRLVLANEISREELYDWAATFVMADDPIINDEEVWEALIIISNIDALESPTSYLYKEEDLKSWIKQFEDSLLK